MKSRAKGRQKPHQSHNEFVELVERQQQQQQQQPRTLIVVYSQWRGRKTLAMKKVVVVGVTSIFVDEFSRVPH
jgi:hypothetical protein